MKTGPDRSAQSPADNYRRTSGFPYKPRVVTGKAGCRPLQECINPLAPLALLKRIRHSPTAPVHRVQQMHQAGAFGQQHARQLGDIVLRRAESGDRMRPQAVPSREARAAPRACRRSSRPAAPTAAAAGAPNPSAPEARPVRPAATRRNRTSTQTMRRVARASARLTRVTHRGARSRRAIRSAVAAPCRLGTRFVHPQPPSSHPAATHSSSVARACALRRNTSAAARQRRSARRLQQRGIAPAGAKGLAVDEDMLRVVHHARAAVQPQPLRQVHAPRRRVEPDPRLGLGQQLAQRARAAGAGRAGPAAARARRNPAAPAEWRPAWRSPAARIARRDARALRGSMPSARRMQQLARQLGRRRGTKADRRRSCTRPPPRRRAPIAAAGRACRRARAAIPARARSGAGSSAARRRPGCGRAARPMRQRRRPCTWIRNTS